MARLSRIDYSNLNARQKENYNFQKLCGVLADYGFVATRLTDDWQGADLLAFHIDGKTSLKIQLKTALAFAKKYEGKEIFIAFFHYKKRTCYLYSHDELLAALLAARPGTIRGTRSWEEAGEYHIPAPLPREAQRLLDEFNLLGEPPE